MNDGNGLPDLSEGWAKFWRKSIDSWVFQDEKRWKVWSYCVMRAAHTRHWVRLTTGRGHTDIELLSGQVIYGRGAWSRKLRIKSTSLGRIITKLEKHGNIAREVGTHCSIITLCAHNTYTDPPTASGQAGGHPTDTQRTPNGHPTDTYKKEKTVETVETVENQEQAASAAAPPKPKRTLKFTDEDMATAEWIWGKIDGLGIEAKQPSLAKWANDVRLMREQDKRPDKEIRKIFSWANNPGCWWSTRLLSPAKLRKQWATLKGQMKDKTHGTRTAGPGQKYDPDAGEDDQPAGLFRR